MTRCTTIGALALFSLVGAAQAAVWPVFPMTSPKPELPAVAEQASLNCVLGFSKDYCNGTVQPGLLGLGACPSPFPPPNSCRTLRTRAPVKVGFFSNNQVCGSSVTATCDESPDGSLDVDADFVIRLQQHCPYRGCWDGDASFTFSDGSVYKGRLTGSMGVGTHRPSTTPSICAIAPSSRDCEKCYDVSFDPHALRWRIGFEGAFKGVRSDADTGEELCFTLSGDFLIPGTSSSPTWGTTWSVVGTADGIHLTFCP